jgi:PAS domain S-box-containing protein
MENWKHEFAAFLALETVRDLTADPRPAWVFSRDGRSVRWSNPAGGAMFGARRFADMAGKTAPETDSFARQLANVAHNLGHGGTLARLRLTSGARAVPLLCQCRPLRTAEGQRGILVIAMEAPGRDVAVSEDAAAAFASDPKTAPASDGAMRRAEHSLPPGTLEAEPPTDTRNTPARHRSTGAQDIGKTQSTRLASQEDEPERFSQALLADDEPPSESGHDTAGALATGARSAERPVSTIPFARKPVRFLWQTDAADRFLFVSPGLGQLVGRTAEIVGETWQDVASRLKLDPDGRIAEALARHDTWSGLTAWWPVEGSEYRVPAELTALPVFGIDQSFQGFRGFGVLKPGDVVTPDVFRDRYGAADFRLPPGALPDRERSEVDRSGAIEQEGVEAADYRKNVPEPDPSADHRSGEEASGGPGAGVGGAGAGLEGTTGPRVVADNDALAGNVVPLRADNDGYPDFAALSPHEESAFDEIAAALADEEKEPQEASETAGGSRAESLAPAGPGIEEPAPEEAAAGEPAADEPAAGESPPDETRGGGPPDARPLAGGLAEAQARICELTSILDTATDGVLVIDEDGNIERVNASGEALFGVKEADLVGQPLADLFDADSRQEAIDYLSGLKENGVASVLNEGRDVNARAGDGTIPVFMTMGRIGSDEKGRFCAVLRDLTYWKQAEAELVAARRNAETASNQKSDFLARVSHEIRTPLNAIIGFSEVMIEERFGPIENERYREYLRDMRTSGEHVVSLVNDLLDISKIEAGKLDLEFDAVPLNSLVRECITLMQPQSNRAHVILRSSLSPDVPSVVADQRTLRQIVLNLLSNSVKFTGPGGQVIASTALLKTGEAVLKVRDTGEGMSDEELTRALEPFRQLTTAALGSGDGTGLGLPLTKALVEANRAEFEIRSARGEGTIVTIVFPPTRVLSE